MDPVFQADDGQWYFWDEIWVDRIGPYRTEGEARRQCASYALYLELGVYWEDGDALTSQGGVA